MLVSVAYAVSGIWYYFSYSKILKLKVNNSSEFFFLVETGQKFLNLEFVLVLNF